MIDAFVRLMNSPREFTGPVNLGNEAEFTILELAELVIELTNSRSKIVRNPLPADDPRQRKPDPRLAESVLGWRATTPLREGLGLTIKYFDDLLAEPRSPATIGR
jgi:UDP-glucuronate decarboxylase